MQPQLHGGQPLLVMQQNWSLYTACYIYAIESIKLARISLTMFDGWLSLSLSTLSMTESSVAVVSSPQNADQSFATSPAPMTSLPRFTVPATRGTCNSDDSSSRSSIDVCGCTYSMQWGFAQHQSAL